MKVTAVQFKARKGDKTGALKELLQLSEPIIGQSDLVVFPEMAATGYFFEGREEIKGVAEKPLGETFDALSWLAAEYKTWVVVGYPEVDCELFFNSALVIDPNGELAFNYRKTLLFDADKPWATPGDSGYKAIDTGAGTFGVGICMDLNDDGFIKWCESAALDCVALPTNWIQEDGDVWTYWAWRMTTVPAALVAANTYGEEGPVRFSGRSAILREWTVLSAAPMVGNAVLNVDLAQTLNLTESA